MIEPDVNLPLTAFAEKLDRHGSDFSRWPDPLLAVQARRLIVSSPEHRSAYEAARALDAMLSAHSAAAARASFRTSESVAASVLEQIGDRSPVSQRWLRNLAAGLVVATLLGAGFALVIEAGTAPAPGEILLAESLVFGTSEAELR